MARHTPRTGSHERDAEYAPGRGSSRWSPRLALPVTVSRDYIRGPVDASLTLLEYGDFECPYCGMAYPIVEAVIGQMGERMRFVFRHFPLADMHPHAERAAEAAEAAGAQDKFWDMYRTLYENQADLSDPALLAYARAVHIDVARFTDDLSIGVHRSKVAEDFMSGMKSGVNGTPTFFINEVRHEGSWDASALLAALQSAKPSRHA
jgi:protein-disulfide isomerase